MKNNSILNELSEKLDEIREYILLGAKRVLTLREACLLTGFTIRYMYKLTSANEIPYYKPNGKVIYFDKTELEGWMKQNRQATQDEIEADVSAYMVTGEHKKLRRNVK